MLHACVEGHLDAQQRAKVDRHLTTDPPLRPRVHDWREQRTGLQDVLSSKLEAWVPPSHSLTALAEARLRTAAHPVARWHIAAGFVLALGLGAASGWFGHRMMPSDEVALLGIESPSAYRVFANHAARAVEVSSSKGAEMTAWMTQTLGRRVAVPDLSSVGYTLLGGLVLLILCGAAVMLSYEKPGGDCLTFYVQPMGIGREAEMQPLDVKALKGYGWINRQTGFSAMSDGDHELLRP